MAGIVDVGLNLGQVVESATELLGKFIPDKDKARQLAHDISTMAARHQQAITMAQIEVNKTEAAHKSLFVAGWRPATGWFCALALANNYIVAPYAVAFGLDVPTLDLGQMMPVLLGMLGLGYLRTDEKKAGVARNK